MKKLSPFDLGMIIAFAVVTLIGGGVWYYLSGKLDAAKQDVETASTDFDKYSTKQVYLPNTSNVTTLQADIDVLKSQIDPLIKAKLQSPDNKILVVAKQDTVTWKHDLDDRVRKLNAEAKVHGVTVPNNFYYGFSRYLDQNPGEEKTTVLTKQLLGIEQIAGFLLAAPVKSINSVRRTYEEDEAAAGPGGSPAKSDKDILNGHSLEVNGGVYTDYPFQIDFETTTDALRKVLDDLMNSPYVFVIRELTIENSASKSPQITDLDKMAGNTGTPSVLDTPGEVASTKSTKGPQFLFGGETLRVQMRVDMIEWKGVAAAAPENSAGPNGGRRHQPRNP